MGKKKSAMSWQAAVVLAAFVLSGCTSGDQTSVPTPGQMNSLPSRDDAKIFKEQESLVGESLGSTMVLKQFSGTGPSTIRVGAFPEGYKQLGATVACTGNGDWEVTFVQAKPGWGKGGCSFEAANSVTYPLDEPAKEPTVEVKVEAGTQIWVTIFAAE